MPDNNNVEKVRMVGATENGLILQGEDDNTYISSPLKDGVPLRPGASIVQLEPTEDPDVLNMKTTYHGKGPTRTSNPKWRNGWDKTFSKTPPREEMN